MPDDRIGADGGRANGEQMPEGETMSHTARHREDEHDEAWLLLPWLANGTLDAAESRQVGNHVAACERCRHELERCQDLAAALRSAPETAPTPHPIQLARLMARIDALDAHDENDENGENDANDEKGENRENSQGAKSNANNQIAAARASDAHGAPGLPGGAGAAEASARTSAGAADGNALETVAPPQDPAAVTKSTLPARRGVAAVLPAAGARRRLGTVLAETPRSIRFALAAQLAALLVLALALSFGIPAPAGGRDASRAGASPARALFHTLSAPSTAGADLPDTAAAAPRPQIRLVFAEQATEKQIRDVLMKVRGRLVDGPSPLGTYTIEIPARTARPLDGAPDSLGIVLAYLTSQPIVRFAEPVAGISSAKPETLPRP